MDAVELFIPALQGPDGGPVGGALRPALGLPDDQLVFGRGVHHRDLQIAESIAPGQHQHARQQIHVDIFLLDPAAGEPAAVVLRVLAELLQGLREFQLQKGGRVGMAAGTGELQRQVSHQMLPKVQAEIFAPAHAQMGKLTENDLMLFRAVSLLEPKTADGFTDRVPQGRLELLGPGEKLFVCQRMEILDDRDQCHTLLLIVLYPNYKRNRKGKQFTAATVCARFCAFYGRLLFFGGDIW